jgi:hypothetical protein
VFKALLHTITPPWGYNHHRWKTASHEQALDMSLFFMIIAMVSFAVPLFL